MARSTKSSNQRPDTLMHDRTSANSMKVLLQRTAGPYIRVKLGHSVMFAECPLYADKRTSIDAAGMSAKRQNRPVQSQQTA
jgi:hypothetical protein